MNIKRNWVNSEKFLFALEKIGEKDEENKKR